MNDHQYNYECACPDCVSKNAHEAERAQESEEVGCSRVVSSEKYRVIQLEEIIPSDSEMLLDDAETWLPLSEDRMGRALINKVYTRMLVTMRTREPAPNMMDAILS